MVEKYIKGLLFEHDCVILPGFGGFLTQYISADIHPITHKFLPPTKRVAFNEHLKNNDGLVVGAVAAGEKVDEAQALSMVETYVSHLRENLMTKRIFELKEIGRFFINRSEQIEFEPDTSVNFLEDSFGLPELIFKPIERDTLVGAKGQRSAKSMTYIEDEENREQEKKSNPAVFIVPLVVLLLGGGLSFLYFNQDNKQFASINPFVIFDKKEAKEEPKVAVNEPAAETAPSETIEEPVNETIPEDVITSTSGRYFIVVASFQQKENALKYQKKLERKNVAATIVEPSDDKNYYRVSIADFSDKETAKNKLSQYKKKYGKSVWILSY